MCNLYNTILELCEKRGIKGAKLAADTGISKGLLTDLKMGRRTGVSAATAQKIASYFGVTVGYLLGEEEPNEEAQESRPVTDDDLMYALFDGQATPEQLEEVKRFAAYVKARDAE